MKTLTRVYLYRRLKRKMEMNGNSLEYEKYRTWAHAFPLKRYTKYYQSKFFASPGLLNLQYLQP